MAVKVSVRNGIVGAAAIVIAIVAIAVVTGTAAPTGPLAGVGASIYTPAPSPTSWRAFAARFNEYSVTTAADIRAFSDATSAADYAAATAAAATVEAHAYPFLAWLQNNPHQTCYQTFYNEALGNASDAAYGAGVWKRWQDAVPNSVQADYDLSTFLLPRSAASIKIMDVATVICP